MHTENIAFIQNCDILSLLPNDFDEYEIQLKNNKS